MMVKDRNYTAGTVGPQDEHTIASAGGPSYVVPKDHSEEAVVGAGAVAAPEYVIN